MLSSTRIDLDHRTKKAQSRLCPFAVLQHSVFKLDDAYMGRLHRVIEDRDQIADAQIPLEFGRQSIEIGPCLSSIAGLFQQLGIEVLS